jgi:hypothetical protein
MTFAVRSRFPMLLLAGAVMALALPVRAEDEEEDTEEQAAPEKVLRTVTVLPFTSVYGQVPQSVGDRTADLVREEITKAEELKLVTAAAPKVKTPAKVEGDVEKARTEISGAIALFEKGKSLLDKKKPKPAADNFEKGIKAFLDNFQGTDDFKPLSNAYVGFITTQVMLGNDSNVTKALGDLIRLDPRRVLTEKDAPAAVVEAFTKERKNVLAQSRGSVRVTSAPAGARVFFDGLAVGETPVEVAGVLPGEHFIRVVKDGVGGFSKKVKSNGDAQTVAATLAAEASGPAGVVARTVGKNSIDLTTIEAVSKLGEAAGAEFVVFGALRASGDDIETKAYALRTKDKALTELPTITVNSELLGATIEVLKVTSDLYTKVSNELFAQAPGTLTVFDGLAAPKGGDGALTKFTVAPAADGRVEGEAEAKATTGGRSGRRGPVTSEDNKPKAVEPAKVDSTSKTEEKPSGLTPLEELELRRQQKKERLKNGGKGPVVTEPKPEEESSNDVVPEAPSKSLNLNAPSKTSGANLSPEELLALEKANEKPSNAGKIALWTGVGVVGAAAIGAGVYFLFLRPTAPTSATATMSW